MKSCSVPSAAALAVPLSLVLLFSAVEAHAGARSRVPPCETGCGDVPAQALSKAERTSALVVNGAALQQRIVAQRVAAGQLPPQALAQAQKRMQAATR